MTQKARGTAEFLAFHGSSEPNRKKVRFKKLVHHKHRKTPTPTNEEIINITMRNPLLLTPAALLASFNMSSHDPATSITTPGVLIEHQDGSSPFPSVNTRHYVCPPGECDWALIVTLRDEDCILDNNDTQPSNPSDARVDSLCPLLVDGYSVYATTTATAPLFANVTSPADTSLAIFLVGRDTYLEFMAQRQKAYTHSDLVEWSQEQFDVYRGNATQFSELTVYDGSDSVAGFFVAVKGYVKDSRGYSLTFHVQAQQAGDNEEYWHVEVESHEHACRTCNFGNQTIVPLVAIVVLVMSFTLFVVCLHQEKKSWEKDEEEYRYDEDSLWQQDENQKQRTDTVPDDNEDDDDYPEVPSV
eukprot:scaffold13066_cov145-Amphora_coffeaeformis.AAC.1